MDQWLSDANESRLRATADRFNMSPSKLLNLIVAVALEELQEMDGEDIEIIEAVRTEEPR